jgi:Cu-Zn family superoxide dismutase
MNAVTILFDSEFKIKGKVTFTLNDDNTTTVHVYAKGLEPGLHGFHIHASGDLSEHCHSLCSHFNPLNKNHGGRTGSQRHLGDLGNISVNNEGIVRETFTMDYLPLIGKHGIIGRSVIIHKDEDDLGKGRDPESKKTGNSGKRLLCGVIGYSKSC